MCFKYLGDFFQPEKLNCGEITPSCFWRKTCYFSNRSSSSAERAGIKSLPNRGLLPETPQCCFRVGPSYSCRSYWVPPTWAAGLRPSQASALSAKSWRISGSCVHRYSRDSKTLSPSHWGVSNSVLRAPVNTSTSRPGLILLSAWWTRATSSTHWLGWRSNR